MSFRKISLFWKIVFIGAAIVWLLALWGGFGDSHTGTEEIQKDSTKALSKLDEKALFNSLRKEYDDVENISWYFDKSTPRSRATNNLHAYIGVKDGFVKPRFVIQYSDSDWIFFDAVTIKTDKVKYDFTGLKPLHDHNGGTVWEWLDQPIDEEYYVVLQDIARSKKAILRLHGSKYHKDRVISKKEKQSLQRVLAVFATVNNKRY